MRLFISLLAKNKSFSASLDSPTASFPFRQVSELPQSKSRAHSRARVRSMAVGPLVASKTSIPRCKRSRMNPPGLARSVSMPSTRSPIISSPSNLPDAFGISAPGKGPSSHWDHRRPPVSLSRARTSLRAASVEAHTSACNARTEAAQRGRSLQASTNTPSAIVSRPGWGSWAGASRRRGEGPPRRPSCAWPGYHTQCMTLALLLATACQGRQAKAARVPCKTAENGAH